MNNYDRLKYTASTSDTAHRRIRKRVIITGLTGANELMPTPTAWPDLETICAPGQNCQVASNTFTCTIYGNAANKPTSPKTLENVQKNRYRFPKDIFPPAKNLGDKTKTVKFADLYKFNRGKVGANGKMTGYPDSEDPNSERLVNMVAYVEKAEVAGCYAGESCYCSPRWAVTDGTIRDDAEFRHSQTLIWEAVTSPKKGPSDTKISPIQVAVSSQKRFHSGPTWVRSLPMAGSPCRDTTRTLFSQIWEVSKKSADEKDARRPRG